MATKTIVIDGPIGQYSFSKQFMRNELSGQSKNTILIKISSLGGSVDGALNIYDQFIEHGYVTAELSAFVASSATLVQPFQKTFTQNGGIDIVPNEIRVFQFKIDDEFMPDELYAIWLGFLTAKQVDRKEWPLVKWPI